jgi:hypothetical protein
VSDLIRESLTKNGTENTSTQYKKMATAEKSIHCFRSRSDTVRLTFALSGAPLYRPDKDALLFGASALESGVRAHAIHATALSSNTCNPLVFAKGSNAT